MPELANLLACPVCLGTTMEKVGLGPSGQLQVDVCRRCGGIWFEEGEVQQMRSLPESALASAVAVRNEPFRMRCHDCHALMERADAACASCGWNNALDCPGCGKPMKVESHAGLRLDICRGCKGVWFDHHELEEIWREGFDRSVQLRRGNEAGGLAGDVAGDVLLHTVLWSPDLIFYGTWAAGKAVGGAIQAAGNAPEIASATFEAVGSAATSVFGVIIDIISGLFE